VDRNRRKKVAEARLAAASVALHQVKEEIDALLTSFKRGSQEGYDQIESLNLLDDAQKAVDRLRGKLRKD
jgi:hypothetical protein